MDNIIQIEINGVKMEVDTRYAKRIETLTIGSRVKVLCKKYSDYAVYPGVIVGFEPFNQLPTLTVAYLDASSYGSDLLKFHAYNANSKDFEIVADIDFNSLEINKADAINRFNREIEKKKLELEEFIQRKEYFIKHFGVYFGEVSHGI